MPTKVMPICTVERKRLGDSANFKARAAPLFPFSAFDCKSPLHEDTIAISVMANTPLATRSTSTMEISRKAEFMK
jgi:hypothetical protein